MKNSSIELDFDQSGRELRSRSLACDPRGKGRERKRESR
jgi:hypothetical protein